MIYADKDVQIDGSTVNACSTGSNGTWINRSLTIQNESEVTATGYYSGIGAIGVIIKNREVEASSDADAGIWTRDSVLTIQSGSKVTADGYNNGIIANGVTVENSEVKVSGENGHGILSHRGEVIITDGTVTITSNAAYNDGNGIFIGDAYDDGYDNGYNLNISGDKTVLNITCKNENVGINTGSITIGGGETIINTPGCGIYATNAPFTMTGGKLTINSGGRGIDAWNADMEISNGTLNITSETMEGIHTNSMDISSGSVSVTVLDGQSPIRTYNTYENNGLLFANGTLTIPNASKKR